MSNVMPALWERVEVQLRQRAPGLLSLLQPGATDQLLEQAGALLNNQLPEEVKQFYACHNGLEWRPGPYMHHLNSDTCVDGWRVHSLDSLCHVWAGEFALNFLSFWQQESKVHFGEERFVSSQRPFQAVYWHPCWLPFLARNYTDQFALYWQHYYIDLVPGPDGQYGQILFVQDSKRGGEESFLQRGSDEDEENGRQREIPQVVAPSLSAFFARFVEELEAGRYRYDEATGMLWSRGEWDAARKRGDLKSFWENRKPYFEKGHLPPFDPGFWVEPEKGQESAADCRGAASKSPLRTRTAET